MLRLGICGSSGRMGSALKDQISLKNKRFQYVAGLAQTKTDSKTEAKIHDWDPGEIDAVIDFSLPDSFDKAFQWCSEHSKPLVSGTTGFPIEDYRSKCDFSFMHSGNYSLGVAGLIKSLESFKNLSEEAHIWIEDYHHINKLDAPSGTAVKIRQKIQDYLDIKEVDVKASRAGSIFGVHNVHIVTEHEWVTLSHKALNRGVFAEGALNAVEWLAEQKHGAYTFEDFLGFS